MSNSISRFNQFFENFKRTDQWRAMVLTRENSPWHREENVAVHTRMLLDWYQHNLMGNRSESQHLLTMVACLFHDVGKPPAQIIKHSEERGEYRAYHGHEQLSARMWMDYALSNQADVEQLLMFNIDDISNVAFMIEHHVPFDLKNPKKRSALKNSLLARMGDVGHRAWLDLLLSDQHGRISDDQSAKLKRVDDWMAEWETV